MTDQPAAQDPDSLRYQAARMGEAQLRDRVIDAVRQHGLKLKVHPDSRRDRDSDRGFPDLVIAGLGGVLWRELKDQHDTPSPGQLAWADTLRAAGQDWAIWRPLDLLSGAVDLQLAALTIRYDPVLIRSPAAGPPRTGQGGS